MPKKASSTIIKLEVKGDKTANIIENLDHEEKEKEKVDTDIFEEAPSSQQKGAGDAPPRSEAVSSDSALVKDSSSKVSASASDDSVVSKPKKTKKNKKLSAKTKSKSSTGKQTQIDIAPEADESQSSNAKDDPPSTPKQETPRRKSFFNLGKKSTTKTPKVKDESTSDQSEGAKTSRPKRSVRDRLLTDFFPVRRSDRRSKAELEKMETQRLEEKILSGCEDGLSVVDIEGKGRGVISTKSFKRGEFIVEYAGDLITLTEAQAKEDHYSLNPDVGCYMYYFKYNNKNYCVDATAESGKLGRLLNHSKNGNCKTKVVGIGCRPYLILIAAKDIGKKEELLYDYGDRSKDALEAHPWLAY